MSKELDEFARECRTAASSPEKAADLPDAVLGLVLTKYRDALLILDRIADEAIRLKPLFSQFRTPGSIESDPVRRAAFDEMLSLASYLRLDIESLYLWTHEIKEALQHSGHRIDLSQLERIAFVRNKFITHLSKQPVFKESEYFGLGTRYGPDCEDVQLFLHPLDVSGVMERPVTRHLIGRLEEVVPELRTEVNHFERLRIIYENLLNIPTDLQRDAKKLLTETGVMTEPPHNIAAALLDALRSYHRVCESKRETVHN